MRAAHRGESVIPTAALAGLLDRMRRPAQRSSDDLTPRELACPRGWGDPELSVLGSELRKELRRALERLSPRQRAVVTLHLLAGFDQNEVAVMLGVGAGRVSQVVQASLRALSAILAEDRRPR